MGRNKKHDDIFESRNFQIMIYNLNRRQKIELLDLIRSNTFSFSEAHRIGQETILKTLALKTQPNQKDIEEMVKDAIFNAEKRKELN